MVLGCLRPCFLHNQPGLPGVKQKNYRAVYRAIYRVYRELTGPTGPRFIYRENQNADLPGAR